MYTIIFSVCQEKEIHPYIQQIFWDSASYLFIFYNIYY